MVCILADFFLLAETEGVCIFDTAETHGRLGVLHFSLLMATKDLSGFRQLLRIPGYRMKKVW